jgi:hypothetical protein
MKKNWQDNIVILIALSFLVVILCLGLFSKFTYSYNFDTENITTQVNVTSAQPDVVAVSINAGQNVTLNAGSTTQVVCNASLRDWNGYNVITAVNATLYYYLNLSGQSDNKHQHYTNTSCIQMENDGLYNVNYTCTFQVYYYALNGTWNCNVTVNDTNGFTGTGNATTNINAVYALNVTNVINFGNNLSIGQYSGNITANVTNFGNRAINVSVLGYGRTQGDGLALVCSRGSNISVNNERFYNSLVDWNIKIPLSNVNQDMNLTVPRQLDDFNQSIYATYWQLYVPPNPFGVCNGTIRFTATTP